jgi:hypothetical protein
MVLSGCFHQVVATGLAPGQTKVDKPWTSTFIFGLVEAKPIDVRQQCPGGVAFVESKFTVKNWLGAVVTLGIWYPWHVTVTCASGGRASLDPGILVLPLNASDKPVHDAAVLSRARGATVALVWSDTASHEEVVP